jgi:hypothetical protein
MPSEGERKAVLAEQVTQLGDWIKAGTPHPIDAFLAVARAQAVVTPQPEAPRHALVSRLFIDLIGRPPQPEELTAIEADIAPD